MFKKLKKLIFRFVPGLEMYSGFYYAKVKKVYSDSGLETAETSLMSVDIQLLDHDLKIDSRFPVFKKIRLAGNSEFVVSPPSVGTYVFLFFPHWKSSTATVINNLFISKKVAPEEGAYKISGCKKLELSALEELTIGAGEDQAVLGQKLNAVLEKIMDQIEALGEKGNQGLPLTNLPQVKTELAKIKTELPDLLSTIKIGKKINGN